MLRQLLAFILLALAPTVALATAPAPGGSVLLTSKEALELTFPKCRVERETVYLTKEQKEKASKLAGKEIESGLLFVYSAYKGDELVGYAYFDTHKVRTKRETVMIALDPDAKVRRVEVLAFAEPKEYLPKGAWYGQFKGKQLNEKLRLKGDIRNVTGATMTTVAALNSVRKHLALHRVVMKKAAGATEKVQVATR